MAEILFINGTAATVAPVVDGGVYVPVFTVVPAGDIDAVQLGQFPFIWQRTADIVSLRGSVNVSWLGGAGGGAFDFTLPVLPGAAIVNLTGSITTDTQIGAPTLPTLWRFVGTDAGVQARASINTPDGTTTEWLIELSYELP